jgi:hypothetical protein
MPDLRLIGVHEDGQHLLLSDADGSRYRLALDEPLRAAARRDRPRLGQLQIEIDGGLRPREVQALVRRGLTTEEVAERSGWSIEKVRRFEGPVLAEREHVARIARQCAVGGRPGGPVTLEDRVDERLTSRGVDPAEIDWDSARDDRGVWRVSMTFAAGGRQRTATWIYQPLDGSVSPVDDEARWLSEDAGPGGIPTPHPVTSAGELGVYDVDADGGVGPTGPSAPDHRLADSTGAAEPIDLMAAMRAHGSGRGRRGRRRTSSPTHTPGDEGPRIDALPLDDLIADPDRQEPPSAARGNNATDEHLDPSVEPKPGEESGPVEKPDSGGAPARRSPPRRPSSARRGRPSVPSWDDIVFGTRGPDPS